MPCSGTCRSREVRIWGAGVDGGGAVESDTDGGGMVVVEVEGEGGRVEEACVY